jgi:hypothetical protein
MSMTSGAWSRRSALLAFLGAVLSAATPALGQGGRAGLVQRGGGAIGTTSGDHAVVPTSAHRASPAHPRQQPAPPTPVRPQPRVPGYGPNGRVFFSPPGVVIYYYPLAVPYPYPLVPYGSNSEYLPDYDPSCDPGSPFYDPPTCEDGGYR